MNTLNRRQFLRALAASGVLAALPKAVRAATTAPRVVVVGGGFAGATAAKYGLLQKEAGQIERGRYRSAGETRQVLLGE